MYSELDFFSFISHLLLIVYQPKTKLVLIKNNNEELNKFNRICDYSAAK